MSGSWPAIQCIRALLLVATAAISPLDASTQSAPHGLDQAAQIVARIQRADYEGDRDALLRLHEELSKVSLPGQDARLLSRLRYWQGFALWRKAFNGFNDGAERATLDRDLQQAITYFEEAIRHDPWFIDANVGQISCLQSLTFLHQADAAQTQRLVSRFVPLIKESLASGPENPRLLWVVGASQWWAPPGLAIAQVVERQDTAIGTYKKGLELVRKQKRTADPLEPTWGETELLRSLAWASLNHATSDPRTAETFARQALGLVPYWHYVRDILLPQIRRAGIRQ